MRSAPSSDAVKSSIPDLAARQKGNSVVLRGVGHVPDQAYGRGVFVAFENLGENTDNIDGAVFLPGRTVSPGEAAKTLARNININGHAQAVTRQTEGAQTPSPADDVFEVTLK